MTTPTKEPHMHDLLHSDAISGMLLSPAIVAAFSGTSESNPE